MKERPEELVQQFGQLHVLDDLIRLRAADAIQVPILAYPTSSQDVTYDYYTGQDLDRLVDQTNNGTIVALLTVSDFSMVLTFFALSRLGYTVMMLSPRLSASACVSLLDAAGCDSLLYGATPSIRSIMGEIVKLKLVSCRSMLQPLASFSEDSDEESMETRVIVLHRRHRLDIQKTKIALILHSSGSTGNPKPLFLSHQALMTHPPRGPGLTSFNPLPWYHLHGLSTAIQAMWMRKTAFLWNAALPVTAQSLTAALHASQPESVHAVPYVLQLLCDSPQGVAVLKQCRLVTFGGAQCPDELGDRLTQQDVRFGGLFGSTETGLVAESVSRPAADPYWNYLRFFDNIRCFIWMKPLGDNLFECVYLAGHPALTVSNASEPPGSFHSRDVFTPHPSLPDRWKYVTRLDDRLTLVNGEKVLPLSIEGRIKQHPLVHDAIAVGVGRAAPGLLLFREETSAQLTDGQFLDAVWPAVQEANAHAEQFSQITRDMIAVMAVGTACPRTDKGSLIRGQVEMVFGKEIESLYTGQRQETRALLLELDTAATKDHLMMLCRKELALDLSAGVDTDLFAAGIDSLKAIHLRRLILRDFKFDDEMQSKIGSNVVLEMRSVSRLAAMICHLQQGRDDLIETEDEIGLMPGLVNKYSSFTPHVPRQRSGAGRSAVLTGATGSLGVHVLYRLLQDTAITTVYCLTRRENAMEAVLTSLDAKKLTITESQMSRITALHANLTSPTLGLAPATLNQMLDSVTLVIHTSWPVNFTLPLSSFEPQLASLHHLLQFSLDTHSPTPALFLFCSSISTVLASQHEPPMVIPETPTDLFTSALPTGYARSKLIGERLVSAAGRTAQARAFSLRIGQVSGHSKRGLWNDSEAITLLIRSALTLHALPDLSEFEPACSWLPVDVLAATILDIARANSNTHSNSSSLSPSSSSSSSSSSSPRKRRKGLRSRLGLTRTPTISKEKEEDKSVYNICNPHTFAWTALLGRLRTGGFEFETVELATWLDALRASRARGEERINPAVKLVEHYEQMYGATGKNKKTIMPRFVTDKAERESRTLRNGRLRMVQDGILDIYVRDWRRRWVDQ
ncbi:hypothetical protein ASPZODRAFT_166529 [Penicilliopsis zonata CBS 506.65]|uniref:Carrier domain-containing protein n=1 Tax=Penicilliopsis zonata CBS 506.65 TaxID=1073090 RepID=A0A1L9SJC0_9EURO|nr:hypothetical protein ASPZODRAFT_166529 [Penicilliopsis zonata CBS 506.65]OJJ47320.1 hypothetical protein ASPZODRAFT_166529 [Penicilliopsis zonata CBS 506.65]